MRTRLKQTALIVPAVALCLITIPSAVAVVSETMGNITFQCDAGWEINGPFCYLLVDQPLTFEDADEICEKYGSDVVEITDEVEAKEVGKMVQRHNPQWRFYWIGNTQTQAADACEGLWDVGEPKDVNVMSNINVAANAPQGRWKGQDPGIHSRLPVVCKTVACVLGTFRCKDGGKCIKDSLKCDGVGDCDDNSDESNCASYYTWYHHESSGTVNKNNGYEAGKTYTWYLEGTPAVPMSIKFTSLDVEADVDYVEVWSGGPSFMKSSLQERLTGSLTNKIVYGYNNFLIVRLTSDLSNQRTGFVATWGPDDELSPRNREITATYNWTELMSPYFSSDPSPLAYSRHYTVTTEEGFLITMELLKNELGEEGFQYDVQTLARVSDIDIFPDTYVSYSNTFSFYLVTNGCEGPEKFRARVKKGCSADLTGANGFVRPPLFDTSTSYPPSVTCTYIIHAPEDAQRAFQLYFNNSQLADAADSVKVYDGGNNSFGELTPSGGYKGNNPIPSTTFRSSGPVVFVEFTSSLVQTDGFFELIFDLACPAITDTDNMTLSSQDTHHGSEVTLSCNTGYAFAQEEFANEAEIIIRCDLGGKWNISRLPTCKTIYCGVPESIDNGFIFAGSGDARYNAAVTYQCFPGFSLTGSNTSTCGDGFAWSTRPTCQASQCSSLGPLANGENTLVTGSGTNFGTVVNYTCDAGYDLVGFRYSACQTDGTWSHTAPSCHRIQCPIPEVAMATLTPATEPVDFEDTLRVDCPTGYVINGTSDSSKTYPCLASGHFDVSQNVCVDKDECEETPCNTDLHEVCVNTKGSYRCDCVDKYRRNNAGTACEVIDQCSEGTSGCDSENGYCNSTNNGEDYICGCKRGYILFTEDGLNGHNISSNETGMTPGDVYYLNHTCVPVKCEFGPATPSNGQVLTRRTSFDFGNSVEFHCNFGYNLTTDSLSADVLTCDVSPNDHIGMFVSDTSPLCLAITCEALTATGLVANIYPNTTTNVGDQVLLECDSETGPRYNKTLYCAYDTKTDTFQLQGDAPHCPAIDCGSINPTGGANFTAPTTTGLNSSFTFTCMEGFVLDGMSLAGNDVVTCQKNGRWGLGNLTCTGERCLDPGTPGGMTQTAANFEVGGDVVYNCTREGFMPNPTIRRCVYNTTTQTADWNDTVPVCEDIEDPVFTVCPTSPVKLKLYSMASSEMAEPKATDNSGLVTITVSPSWFHRDIRLAESLNVTYTAHDGAGRTSTCYVTIEVNDPEVLPALTCPNYLPLEVNSSTPYNITLADHVTAENGIMLTYSSGPVLMVGPETIGKTAVRVMATDMYGFERQCAFVVDIQPNVCLSTYVASGATARNSNVNCQNGGDGILNCTVTCNDNFAFQDGTTTMSYDCHGANEWFPALPARSCVETTAAKYLYVVDLTYSFIYSTISNCQTSLTAKLTQVIPTQTINTCVFAGGTQSIHFSVIDVQYTNIGFRSMTATIELAVTSDLAQITKGDYDACAPRFNDASYTGSFFATPATSVDCGTSGVHNLTHGDQFLVRHGKSCSTGYVLENVGNTDKCVPCEPGYYYNGSVCLECGDGKYQDQAGQTQCKTCENGAQFTTQPRLSADQCVASCFAGFFNNMSHTPTPSQCNACPVDTYVDTPYTASCTACDGDTTTSGVEGATACKDKCPAGQYPVNNTNCAPCPVGYYKATVGNVACTTCNPNETTTSTGSTASSQCVSISLPTCQNGGTGRVDYRESYCDCPVGYYGDMCQNITDACSSNPCYNGGNCIATGPFSYNCSCPNDSTCTMVASDIIYSDNNRLPLANVGIDLNACKQKCLNTVACTAIIHYVPNACVLFSQYINGSSSETSFIKSCSQKLLFGGDRCETDLTNNCDNDTCANIDFCRDLLGSADCVCPSDSKYTGSKCEINLDLCSNNPCQNGGSCEDSGNGVRYTCICKPGYTGDNCETDINECGDNPDGCLYGGTCNDGINNYSCNCNMYNGDHCQILPDFCGTSPNFCDNGVCYNDYNISSAVCVCHFPYRKGADGRCEEIDICAENNPCEHNSTCSMVSPGVTSCQCPAGYTGSLCQHNINNCDPDPCVYGKCTDHVNDYSCDCDPGYNGTYCDNNINDCPGNCSVNNTMPNGCEDLVEDYRCQCKVGFTGKDCETDIDECQSLPCQHNGTCTESLTPGQYMCSCVDGWTGQNCESLPQFCNDSTCENGGQCFSLQDNFFCKCASGTYGQTCQTTSDLCSIVDPCTAAGTCQSGDGTATCQCQANYTGSSCNLIKDGCSSSPCQNGGTCVTHSLGYTCQCGEGYSGDNCSTEASVCDSANCPSGSQCIEVDNKAACLCSANQQRSGDSCKDMSNDFDIYFTKPGNAIRSSQPFRMTENLTLMFWMAPLAESGDYPVQLRLSNGTTFLAVNKENVTFGQEDPVRLEGTSRILTGFTDGQWNQFAVTWNGSHYDLYLNGIDLAGGVTAAEFPSQNELVFIFIGADFKGYISQVMVWGRVMPLRTEALLMYADPLNPSDQNLLARWSDYHLSDNLQARVIHPSIVPASQTVCDNGQSGSACLSSQSPDKEPPTVNNCPEEISAEAERLVQVNDYIPSDMFTGAASIVSNLDRTLLTFGAHRLVYMASDEHNNVAFCRINAYVKRQGQSCSNKEGLNTDWITDCMGKGQKVQCPNNGKAPLSPEILTCGKLGSYNLDNWYQLPPAVMCGASEDFKYTITLTLKYKLFINCDSSSEDSVKSATKIKVKDLNNDWITLCVDSNCNNVESSAKCEGADSKFVTATVVIRAVPPSLTHQGTNVMLTARELFLTATKELNAFAIPTVFNAELQKDMVVILAEKSCSAGFGLHDDVCVECTEGSFLNETSGMCQLCPIGSFTDAVRETACTACQAGKTTLQLGAKLCYEECASGKYFDLGDDQCKDCMKNFYQNETGQVACIPCPPGKATESTGANSADLCYDTCDAGTELKNSTCVPCPRGKYSDGIEQETCVDCPAGNTTAGEQSTSMNQCYQPACEPGHFRNSSTNMCEECDYGFYQPEQWQDQCLPCMDNYSTMNKASTNASQCLFYCAAGYEVLSAVNHTCRACEQGKFKTNEGSAKFGDCQSCPSLNTTTTVASESETDCNISACEPGHFRNSSTNMCEECDYGFFQPERWQDQCLPCMDHYTTENKASTNASQCLFYCAAGYEVLSAVNRTCRACERGRFKTNEGNAKFGSCQSCPSPNTTNNVASESEADCSIPVCEAGQTISSAGVCNDCPNDFYQDVTLPDQNTNCTYCGNGRGTMLTKQTSESDCKPVCGPGEQYDSNTASCVSCPLGTWNSGNDTQRFEQCTPCPDGLVTVNEMTGATSIDNCTLRNCPAGTFIDGNNCTNCPVGEYQNIPRQTSCKHCPTNTNTSGEGHDDESDCTISCGVGQEQAPGSDICQPCQADYIKDASGPGRCTQCTGNSTANAARTVCNVLFCDIGFKINTENASCDACEVGTYKAERGNTGMCVPCPTNTTTADVASTSESNCDRANCVSGFYSPDGTLPCLACPVGTYKDTTGNQNCTSCNDNFTTTGVASTASSQCSLVVCSAGQFRTSQNQCQACPVGSFQNETGQTSCHECPDGYNTTGSESRSADDCRIVCPVGEFRNDSTNTCENCPVGQYQDNTGQTSCTPCPETFTTAAAGSNHSSNCYIVCSAGNYSTSRTACQPCPNGKYQPSSGAATCDSCLSGKTTLSTGSTSGDDCQPICGLGQYLNTMAKMCMDCPLGTYNPVAGNETTAVTECQPCPDGNTTTMTGAVDINSCNISDCKPGTFRSSSSSAGCQECPKGQYQPQKSQTSCIPCDGNLTTYTTGRISNESCITQCMDGEEYDVVTKGCSPCSLGYYRKATETEECVKCADGYTTLEAGQSTCIEEATSVRPRPVRRRIIRIRIRLRIGSCANRDQVGNVIIQFIINTLLRLDLRFPAICRNSCENLVITFKFGCLRGFRRGRRQTNRDQEVELALTGVNDEVQNKETKVIQDSLTTVKNAFIDIQPEAKTLEKNNIDFLGVQNASYIPECQPGEYINSTECEPCAAGTYSNESLSSICTLCDENTYQNSPGQSNCTDCPLKTYTTTRGSTSASDCHKKCDEPDATQTYCSGHGTCVFDVSTSNGVRCVCDDKYSGNNCASRLVITDDKPTMIGGIVGGASAFLLLLLIIIGIVAYLRRSAKKGKNGYKDGKHLYRHEDSISETNPNYNFPLYERNMQGYTAKPAIMYMNPVGDQDVRDYYMDRSTAPTSRPRSQSYESEWQEFQETL